MANWEELLRELDTKLKSMTPADWKNWKLNRKANKKKRSKLIDINTKR